MTTDESTQGPGGGERSRGLDLTFRTLLKLLHICMAYMYVGVCTPAQATHYASRTLELWCVNFRRGVRDKSIISYVLCNYFIFLLITINRTILISMTPRAFLFYRCGDRGKGREKDLCKDAWPASGQITSKSQAS